MDISNKKKDQEAGLCLRDLIILQRFLEKGKQNDLFSAEEKYSVEVVYGKLSKLIEESKKLLQG